MGGKKRKLQNQSAPRSGGLQHKGKPLQKGGGADGGSSKPAPVRKHKQQHHEKPDIPFEPEHRIFLYGEGDLSFAASIIKHYGCTNVTATVLEKNLGELQEKYPHADGNIAIINGTVDERKKDETEKSGNEVEKEEESDVEDEVEETEEDDTERKPSKKADNRIAYNIDATKSLPSTLARPLYDRIFFNFPHVGGKSTDVNRQVRYNQELLVGFFQRSALPALAPGGCIVVTLFEGEPYTLWNIRDLGRHAGLQVERSFPFRADLYPGYHHARTLGVVRSRKGEAGGGWKGEQRASRSYVFMRKGDVAPLVSKKRRRDNDESSDGED